MRLALLTFPALVAACLHGQTPKPCVLVIHGGAGSIVKAKMTPEKEAAARKALEDVLKVGMAILEKGGTSLDAVDAVVRAMEDDPLFNAGKGAVMTAEGTHELDAAIMDGRTLGAGSVAGLRHIKNPIGLARLVMEQSPHVMLVGQGAEAFAKRHHVTFVPNAYFRTPERWAAFQKVKAQERAQRETRTDPKGTVGAVALDQHGNLAAATSTGGMMNKRWGRVGDAPLIGSGTYADNSTCAVSCTGWGEFFIRVGVAHDIHARMAYGNAPLNQAAQAALDKVARLGGNGGLIAVDTKGNLTMPFNTEGMYRGFAKSGSCPEVKLYAGE